jgi:hypothetical protein
MEASAPVVVAVAPTSKASGGVLLALLALGGVGYLMYGRKA